MYFKYFEYIFKFTRSRHVLISGLRTICGGYGKVKQSVTTFTYISVTNRHQQSFVWFLPWKRRMEKNSDQPPYCHLSQFQVTQLGIIVTDGARRRIIPLTVYCCYWLSQMMGYGVEVASCGIIFTSNFVIIVLSVHELTQETHRQQGNLTSLAVFPVGLRATSCSAGCSSHAGCTDDPPNMQAIPRLLWNKLVHCLLHKNMTLAYVRETGTTVERNNDIDVQIQSYYIKSNTLQCINEITLNLNIKTLLLRSTVVSLTFM
jgi:hypothetical protein